ncbi:MAG: DUF433 domain-containing protein [Hyphomicrobium sp.]|nr:DUF433 domain-containing protein [Hyphomicrobium sp.]
MAHERITADPKVMMGKPVIKGTRITVELVLRLRSKKHSVAEILDGYPNLTEDDIYAAEAYAADYLASERILAAE